MNPEGPNVVCTSQNIRKIKFTTYIYISFNQNFVEKISIKIEEVKQLHAVYFAYSWTALMRSWRRPIRL